MAKSPVQINLVKPDKQNYVNNKVEYVFSILEKGNAWNYSRVLSRDELLKVKEEVDLALSQSSTAEILDLTEKDGKIVDTAHSSDPLCNSCPLKMTQHCVTCLFKLGSPLERKLYLELRNHTYLGLQVQYGIGWNGDYISTEDRYYSHPTNNFKSVLTIADFYFEKRGTKLCVYTDGHTYHERTEAQAQRDRNIDRKLQELGYKVLRYTGKDINESMNKVVNEIKSWMERN